MTLSWSGWIFVVLIGLVIGVVWYFHSHSLLEAIAAFVIAVVGTFIVLICVGFLGWMSSGSH